jgi:phage/plasmid-like protein (TIGR03299 family)
MVTKDSFLVLDICRVLRDTENVKQDGLQTPSTTEFKFQTHRRQIMAHNLSTINGKVAMVLNGKREDAWHNLGQRVTGALTAEQAIELAQLQWNAVKVQNYARQPDGKVVPVDSFSIFRDIDNQLLGSAVGKGFTLVQNREAFSFCDALMQSENGAHYDSAGALGNGETIFLSIRVPRADIEVVAGDKSETYLTFTTAHDGSGASTAALSSVRVVCQNTLRQALATNTGILRIKHTKNQANRFEMAKRTMDGVTMDAQKLREKLQLISERKVTRESLTAVFDRLFPIAEGKEEEKNTRRENILGDILALYEGNDGNAFPSIRGTGYNLLNSITEYSDHYRPAKLTANRQGYTVARARAENAVVGTGDALKTKALEVILESTVGAPVVSQHKQYYAAGVGTTGSSVLDSVVAATV